MTQRWVIPPCLGAAWAYRGELVQAGLCVIGEKEGRGGGEGENSEID